MDQLLDLCKKHLFWEKLTFPLSKSHLCYSIEELFQNIFQFMKKVFLGAQTRIKKEDTEDFVSEESEKNYQFDYRCPANQKSYKVSIESDLIIEKPYFLQQLLPSILPYKPKAIRKLSFFGDVLQYFGSQSKVSSLLTAMLVQLRVSMAMAAKIVMRMPKTRMEIIPPVLVVYSSLPRQSTNWETPKRSKALSIDLFDNFIIIKHCCFSSNQQQQYHSHSPDYDFNGFNYGSRAKISAFMFPFVFVYQSNTETNVNTFADTFCKSIFQHFSEQNLSKTKKIIKYGFFCMFLRFYVCLAVRNVGININFVQERQTKYRRTERLRIRKAKRMKRN